MMSGRSFHFRTVIAGGLIFLGSLILVPSLPALEINIKSQITVRGDQVYLGDIASFQPADDERVPRLRRVEVVSAPAPANAFRLKRRFLTYKLTAAIGEQEGIRLKVPPALKVHRAAQFVNRKRLEEIFRGFVLEDSPWSPDKVRFERIQAPQGIALPEGKLSWKVMERGSRRHAGNIPTVVYFYVDGKEIRKVPVSGKVSILQASVRAAGKIRSGQIIGHGDVVLAEDGHHKSHEDMFSSIDAVVGKKARRNIRSGQPITGRMIEDPPAVKKGNRVLLKAENASIKVTALGRVLQDGRVGDQVRVLNTTSGKEVLAVVEGPGLVSVSF
jgi:flagella basal body P-ring formation protein FlgA